MSDYRNDILPPSTFATTFLIIAMPLLSVLLPLGAYLAFCFGARGRLTRGSAEAEIRVGRLSELITVDLLDVVGRRLLDCNTITVLAEQCEPISVHSKSTA